MDIFTRSGVILAPLSPPIVRGTRGVALHTNRGNQTRRVNRGEEGREGGRLASGSALCNYAVSQ